MKHHYLEITFRRGKPLAAYLYLPRAPGAKAVRTTDEGHGVRADFDDAGHLIGLEVTAPALVTLEDINKMLTQLGSRPLPSEDWSPLRAA
jgi:hypothetical protein